MRCARSVRSGAAPIESMRIVEAPLKGGFDLTSWVPRSGFRSFHHIRRSSTNLF